ncbi:armadillo-type protein [Pisolithus croceorrhizus]|nr:armadillo-type protein [Pisolithus croceorrhizus]
MDYSPTQWGYYPMQPPLGMAPNPHAPGPTPQGLPHPNIPLSPRTQPPPLPPGTPSMAHAVPHSPHTPQPPPPLAHQPSTGVGMSPPPSTPSASTVPGGRSLNTNATTFVPTSTRSHKITIKSEDGKEVKLESLKKPSPQPSTTPIPPSSPIATSRRTPSVRIESEEAKRKREEQARLEQEKQEAEERAKQEEEERKRKEEEAAKRREEEEEERKRKEKEEEEERARKEEEEKIRQEEERKRREEEERLEEERRIEERLREEKEREERERREREQAELEEKERAEREAERQRQEEAEAETRKDGDIVESPIQESLEIEEGEVVENGEVFEHQINGASNLSKSQKESLRIDTSEVARRRPGPLDINAAKQDSSAPPLSALLTARNIDRLDEVEYPEGIRSPKTELNQNAKDGKFRYDRDFLLQFMAVCKEKPPHLPQLDILGIEPVDQSSFGMSRGGSGRHRPPSGPMSAAGARSASIGLGLGQGFKPGPPTGPFAMGQFGTPGTKLTSEERFLMSQGVRSASVGSGPAAASLNRPALTRTPSQGGPGGHPMGGYRTRSKRGEKRNDPSKVGSVQQGPGFGPGVVHQIPALEPVAPLEASANRWVPASVQRKGAPDADSPEVVDRKVKGLLNKLTMEKFDSISDQIIAWANKSENEKDGRTLIQVIRLVFEKATDEANWSEMYARLCRKMMETISPKVQDDGIKNAEGKPITGGQLFRKYLLNRCQEDFERGWVAKEATARAAAAKASDDEAIKAANEKKGDESELYSDEYYAAQKAKRQGLGLIKFIGELFKLQMLTERIMHECVKKLLSNVENPEEEEIESLCQLLRTVGKLLDVQKAHGHMDIYFQRMRELCKSPNVSPRMQFMLQDVIELRERKWQPRNVVNAPTTLAAVHEAAAKEKAAQENQAFQRQFSMSRGGSRRGVERNAEPAPDGWAVAGGSQPRPPSKAGDLSHFGKISKAAPMVMGPSSVFAGKKDTKRESLTRTNSSSNMFSMLSQNPELPVEPKPSRAPSRRPSTDMDKPEPAPQRRKLQLLPRSIPAPGETPPPTSEDEPEGSPATQMSEEDAKKKIDEDVKEFFAVRNLEEADAYFTALTEDHRFRLVDKLVSSALEGKEADARLVADFFSRSASQQECSPDAFEAGFTPMVELLDDIAIDAPKAPEYMAIMLKGAGLDKDEERLKRMAEKMMDSDKLLQLVSS